MEFLFSCSTRYLTRSACSFVRYQVEHLKGNFISLSSAHVSFSISLSVYIRYTLNVRSRGKQFCFPESPDVSK